MKNLITLTMKIGRDVNQGDKVSLLSLFKASERFNSSILLADASEDTEVRTVIGNVGEIDLKLGAQMKKGKHKNIMTLFWYSERSKLFEIKKSAKSGEQVAIKIYLMTG